MIQLNKQHLQIIFNHAQSTYPEECCGVILGHLDRDTRSRSVSEGLSVKPPAYRKTVVEIIPTQNAWNSETASVSGSDLERSRKRRYTIAPQDMFQLQKSSRAKNLNIIGIFHSHPDYPAIPSEFDRNCAWQEYSYIIVSVEKGKIGDINSWVLDDNSVFEPEELSLGNGETRGLGD